MSAYMVCRETIRYLVQSAGDWRDGAGEVGFRFHRPGESFRVCYLDPASMDALGRMLWAENAKSVRARYSDADEAGMIEEGYESYTHEPANYRFDPGQIAKTLACYDYQACEHPEYRQSAAYAFVEAFRARLLHHLPGFETASWGAPPEQLREPGIRLSSLMARQRAR